MTLTFRQAWVGLRFLLVMTVALGVVYPSALYLVGRAVPASSDGSYVTDATGRVVGSRLIGQAFDGARWFLPRPSAAGAGYDGLSSGGSNLAADNPTLVKQVASRKASIAAADGVAPSDIPADAVTASGSGLDPDISPEYARLQVARVARARGIAEARVAAVVESEVQGRVLGFIGEPRVNVLELNLALEQLG